LRRLRGPRAGARPAGRVAQRHWSPVVGDPAGRRTRGRPGQGASREGRWQGPARQAGTHHIRRARDRSPGDRGSPATDRATAQAHREAPEPAHAWAREPDEKRGQAGDLAAALVRTALGSAASGTLSALAYHGQAVAGAPT